VKVVCGTQACAFVEEGFEYIDIVISTNIHLEEWRHQYQESDVEDPSPLEQKQLRVEIKAIISVGTNPVIIISSTYMRTNKEEE